MCSWKVKDIAGCEVFDADGTRLGVLTDVLPTGANDVWVVKSDLPRVEELLVPALKDVVREVDEAGRRIVVALPPGLRAVYEAPVKEPRQKKDTKG